MRPIIALTADRRPAGSPKAGPRVRPSRPEVFVAEALVQRLRAAGAEVVLLPPLSADPEALAAHLFDSGLVTGLVISGGAFDIHPSHYGQAVAARLDRVDDERTRLELSLARAALSRGVACLGVCGGMQVMAVASGGSLVQDIRAANPAAADHEQPTDPACPAHAVHLLSDAARSLFEVDVLHVNSTHHQAVADPGAAEIVGRAPDGTAELTMVTDGRFAVGVQWHPELLDDPSSARLFAALTRAARA